MVAKKAAGTAGFAVRLVQACDDVPHVVPAHGEGRQHTLAKRLGLSQEAVRKWFAGEAMPRRETMRRLARLLEVEEPWLALGITPELTEREKSLQAKNVEGAVLLVMGHMMLAGAMVAQPGDRDPNRDFVDFYAIMNGSQLTVHVALARHISNGHYEVYVPREFQKVTVVAVVPIGRGKYEFIQMAATTIDSHKQRRSGRYAISLNRIEGRYFTGAEGWTRIKSFEDLA